MSQFDLYDLSEVGSLTVLRDAAVLNGLTAQYIARSRARLVESHALLKSTEEAARRCIASATVFASTEALINTAHPHSNRLSAPL